MTGAFNYEIDKYACIDDVVIDQIIVRVLDVGKVHMCGPVHEQQHNRERRTHSYQQTRYQRHSYEQMPIFHQVGQHRSDRWIGKRRVDVVKSFDMTEEPDDEFIVPKMMDSCP